jgi:hypothetical protein
MKDNPTKLWFSLRGRTQKYLERLTIPLTSTIS